MKVCENCQNSCIESWKVIKSKLAVEGFTYIIFQS